jgi:hypothetical protein
MMIPNRDDEHELLAWIEGELSDREARAVEARLADHPDLRQLCEMMRADRAALRAMGDVDAPEGLVDDVQHALERSALLDGDTEPVVIAGPEVFDTRRHRAVKRWIGVAACLIVGGGVLMIGHQAGVLPTSSRGTAPTSSGQFAIDADVEKDEGQAEAPVRQTTPDVWSDEFQLTESAPAPADEKGGRIARGAGAMHRPNLRDATTSRAEAMIAADDPAAGRPSRESAADQSNDADKMTLGEDMAPRAGETIAEQTIDPEPGAPTAPAQRGLPGEAPDDAAARPRTANAASLGDRDGAESGEGSAGINAGVADIKAIGPTELERLIARREIYLRLSGPVEGASRVPLTTAWTEGEDVDQVTAGVTSETSLHEYIWRLSQNYTRRPHRTTGSAADERQRTRAAGDSLWPADETESLPPAVASELIEGLERLRVVRRVEAREPSAGRGVAFLQLGQTTLPKPFLPDSWQVELVHDRDTVLEAERLLLESQDSLFWWRHEPWVTPQRTAWLVLGPDGEDDDGPVAGEQAVEPASQAVEDSSEHDQLPAVGDEAVELNSDEPE